MSDKKKNKPNYSEGLSQAAQNLAAAGVGSLAGYYGGGLLAKKLVESKRFRSQYRKMSPAERKLLANKIRLIGSTSGAAAGGLSSYALSNAFNKEAALLQLCTKIQLRYI